MRPIDADYMKEHIEGNDSKTIKNIMEWIDNQPTIEPRQVTGKLNDCISRQMMLDGLARIAKAKAKSDTQKSLMGRIIFFTEHLPSVQPETEERTGESAQNVPKDELISRKAAIDAVRDQDAIISPISDDVLLVDKAMVMTELMMLPSVQPEKQHGRIFQGIIVEYPTISTYPECEGKPYFSIKYTENGQAFIGYGTYKPEVLSEYLKEDFMPSVQLQRKIEEAIS